MADKKFASKRWTDPPAYEVEKKNVPLTKEQREYAEKALNKLRKMVKQ